jgi:hypothetical protein
MITARHGKTGTKAQERDVASTSLRNSGEMLLG